MLNNDGPDQPPRTSGALAAEAIGKTLADIERDLADVARKAARFGDAYQKLWTTNAIRKDPHATRLLTKIACARSPGVLALQVDALKNHLSKSRNSPFGRLFLRPPDKPQPAVMRVPTPLADRLSEWTPRRTFLRI